jgi:hypothetical protein
MTAATGAPRSVAGHGWAAEIHPGHTDLHVDPFLDSLPEAMRQLISASQRRFWTLEWICFDIAGWDVYVLIRDLLTT